MLRYAIILLLAFAPVLCRAQAFSEAEEIHAVATAVEDLAVYYYKQNNAYRFSLSFGEEIEINTEWVRELVTDLAARHVSIGVLTNRREPPTNALVFNLLKIVPPENASNRKRTIVVISVYNVRNHHSEMQWLLTVEVNPLTHAWECIGHDAR